MTDLMLLTGKSALITGSTSGIIVGAVFQDELVRKAAALIPSESATW